MGFFLWALQSDQRALAHERIPQKLFITYALGPGFSLTVSCEGDHCMAQVRGQPKIEIIADSPTTFFLKDVDARILLLSIQQVTRPAPTPGAVPLSSVLTEYWRLCLAVPARARHHTLDGLSEQ